MRPPPKKAGPVVRWYYDQYQTVIKKAQASERARLEQEAAREAADRLRREQEAIAAAARAEKDAEAKKLADLEAREKALAEERAEFERSRRAAEEERKREREAFEQEKAALSTERESVQDAEGFRKQSARELCDTYLKFLRETEDRSFNPRNPEDAAEARRIAMLTGANTRSVFSTLCGSPEDLGIAA